MQHRVGAVLRVQEMLTAHGMDIADFDYTLPPERIAQTPVEPRDSSRLLVLHRATGAVEHHIFRDIGEYLRPGDLLVANQSRVLPARLRGIKEGSGGAVELLLLAVRADLGPDTWEALVRPGKRVHEGQRLVFGGDELAAEVLGRTGSGGRIVRLLPRAGTLTAALERLGSMPLPPYIRTPLADRERYQTVYAREPGSAAAPTAGLHFTPGLLARLQAQGVETAFVTLHIGLDTFRPISEATLEEHRIHSEEIELDETAAARVNAARERGRRIVAVGTPRCARWRPRLPSPPSAGRRARRLPARSSCPTAAARRSSSCRAIASVRWTR